MIKIDKFSMLRIQITLKDTMVKMYVKDKTLSKESIENVRSKSTKPVAL